MNIIECVSIKHPHKGVIPYLFYGCLATNENVIVSWQPIKYVARLACV